MEGQLPGCELFSSPGMVDIQAGHVMVQERETDRSDCADETCAYHGHACHPRLPLRPSRASKRL